MSHLGPERVQKKPDREKECKEMLWERANLKLAIGPRTRMPKPFMLKFFVDSRARWAVGCTEAFRQEIKAAVREDALDATVRYESLVQCTTFPRELIDLTIGYLCTDVHLANLCRFPEMLQQIDACGSHCVRDTSYLPWAYEQFLAYHD